MNNEPGGKGDVPRPMDIDRKKFEENFERIFGKQQEPRPTEQPKDAQ